MREQIYLPTGEGSNKSQEEGSAPKVLGRPSLPVGLERPRPLSREKVVVGFRCSCGQAGPKYVDCRVIPLYEEDGWSGGPEYDGREMSKDEMRVRFNDYYEEQRRKP